MSISFTCGRCGKAFDVDDRFAGKQGRCKQCGSLTQIPANPASRRSDTVTRDAASEISPSRRAPARATAPTTGEDVHGCDAAPSPPRSAASAVADDSPPAWARAGRKSAGSSSPGPKKTLYSGGPTAGGALKRVGIGIAAGMVGLLVKTVVIPAIQRGGDPDRASRSSIEAFLKRQIDGTVDLAGIIRGVTDVPSAVAASPGANASLRALAGNLRANKDRQGDRKEVDALKARYQDRRRRASRDLVDELARVAAIPEALDALAIEAGMREYTAVTSSIPVAGTGMPFAPSQFNLPRLITPPGPGPGPVPTGGRSTRPGARGPDFGPPG